MVFETFDFFVVYLFIYLFNDFVLYYSFEKKKVYIWFVVHEPQCFPMNKHFMMQKVIKEKQHYCMNCIGWNVYNDAISLYLVN